ncbi:phosphopantetheine-binding protein [Hoeflea sp. G2-23]|uniref:Phosphopantetheine-binding protein n=1 Tax=Hoeflea algicola TaxID=2983763 RepID=A0ABT3ZB46_9HYPH|nr:phosphopantetheine-binding protein [Hoeflea algicola]MCY0149019.1 phosphopantetheine-binding protein [Hoeflea algicola]
MSTDIETSTIALIAAASEMEASEITRETELADLEVDSLALTEIVMDIEDENNIEIDLNTAEAWQSLKTVGDIIAVVEKLVAART